MFGNYYECSEFSPNVRKTFLHYFEVLKQLRMCQVFRIRTNSLRMFPKRFFMFPMTLPMILYDLNRIWTSLNKSLTMFIFVRNVRHGHRRVVRYFSICRSQTEIYNYMYESYLEARFIVKIPLHFDIVCHFFFPLHIVRSNSERYNYIFIDR